MQGILSQLYVVSTASIVVRFSVPDRNDERTELVRKLATHSYFRAFSSTKCFSETIAPLALLVIDCAYTIVITIV